MSYKGMDLLRFELVMHGGRGYIEPLPDMPFIPKGIGATLCIIALIRSLSFRTGSHSDPAKLCSGTRTPGRNDAPGIIARYHSLHIQRRFDR